MNRVQDALQMASTQRMFPRAGARSSLLRPET
eukprot:COSAG01_NODE_59728_length_298_cov_1.688442_1_plen_31_part_10